MRSRFLAVAMAIGVGLMAAPLLFQMFSRAPLGGEMIDDFRPYMTQEKVDTFQGHMEEIDAANEELATKLPSLLEKRAGIAPAELADRYPSVTAFGREWPNIKADMGDDMLVMIERMLPNFGAVAALPPFPLFPWFFVLPGAFVAIVAGLALRRDRGGRPARSYIRGVGALGIAIVLAPAIFQMFSRAPKGKEMIDEFRPLMTAERVSATQGYFLVIASGEGELRTQVRTLLAGSGMSEGEWESELPAVARFSSDWPKISNEFAPMIGAMSDNLDNYAAVDALPPFSLFPWFFVVPGLLIAGLAIAADRRSAFEAVEHIDQADAGDPARLERRTP